MGGGDDDSAASAPDDVDINDDSEGNDGDEYDHDGCDGGGAVEVENVLC